MNNLPVGIAIPYQTTANDNLQQHTSQNVVNGEFAATLQPQSITTFDSFYSAGPASGNYTLQNNNSGFVLGIAGASTSQGAQAVQYFSNGSTDQLWTLSQQSDGTYRIIDVNSGLSLGVAGGSTLSGANVVQWPSVVTPNQSWNIYGTPNGCYIIINVGSGMKLTISGASKSLNATATKYSDDGSSAEMWTLTQH